MTGVFFLIMLLLWIGMFAWFYRQVPREKDFGNNQEKTDAIVVLTGGMGRLEHGFGLLAKGHAKVLFISGVDQDVSPRDLAGMYDVDVEALLRSGKLVILGYEANNTIGNAWETARWMKAEGYGSLRLVTSSYHMPRSLLEFQQVFPSAHIVADPVFPPWGQISDVVLVPRGSLRLILLEFHKYMVRRVYYWIQSWRSHSEEEVLP